MTSTGFLLLCLQACLFQQYANGMSYLNNGYGPGPAIITPAVELFSTPIGYKNGVGSSATTSSTTSTSSVGGLNVIAPAATSSTTTTTVSESSAGVSPIVSGISGVPGYSVVPGVGYGPSVGILPVAQYGGQGTGNLALSGEIPVSGSTLVWGEVPILGSVVIGGVVQAAGAVEITGSCNCGCQNYYV